jgi:hypothetical protein
MFVRFLQAFLDFRTYATSREKAVSAGLDETTVSVFGKPPSVQLQPQIHRVAAMIRRLAPRLNVITRPDSLVIPHGYASVLHRSLS